MKRQYVEALQEGDKVNDYFVAARKDLRTQASGGKFLGMVFQDKTGDIGGIMWTNAEAVASNFETGDVVNVRGTVSSYQERLQIRVDQVVALREGEFQPEDLVCAPENADEKAAEFRARIETIEDEWLRKLVNAFLEDEAFMSRFESAAAGKRWHHAYRGGLVAHCNEMVQIAECMAGLFPEINRDMLITAIFLHDIGKIEEMTQDLLVEYTDAGKLLGHVTMGADMVTQRLNAIDDFPESLRLQVLHCVLAHHGELINGAPVVPKTLEALVLYHIDNLDAQANAFCRIMEDTRNKRQTWSEYIGLIERQVWTRP